MTPTTTPPAVQSPTDLLASAKSREKRSLLYSLVLICFSLGASLLLLLSTTHYLQNGRENLTYERDLSALRDTLNAKISSATEHSRETHDQIQKINSELTSLTSLIKATSSASAAAAAQLAQLESQLNLMEDKAQIAKSGTDFAQKNLEQKISSVADATKGMQDDFNTQIESLEASLRITGKQLQQLTSRMVEVEARENQDNTTLDDAKRAIGQK